MTCAACNHQFTTEAAFDRHRYGKYRPISKDPKCGRKCLPLKQMRKIFVQNPHGLWDVVN